MTSKHKLVAQVRFSVRQRLAHIEETLFWKGQVSRRDLQEKFGISNQKAALDFADYLAVVPGNIAYNTSLKRYTPALRFQPVFYQPDVGPALMRWTETELVPAFDRPLVPSAIRGLVMAANQRRRCRVRYRSMHTGSVGWREVSPHTFVFNAERWHARVYDYTTAKWCDMVLGRVDASRVLQIQGEPISEDTDWVTEETLTFEADQRFLSQQQTTLLRDYGARGGMVRLKVRRAMIYYVASRLGLLRHPTGWLQPRGPTKSLLGAMKLPGYV